MADEIKKNAVENSSFGDVGGNVVVGDGNIFNYYAPRQKLTAEQKDRLELLKGLSERYQERLSKKMEYENNLFIPFEPQYTKVGTSETYKDIILKHYEEGKHTDFSTLYQDFVETHKSLLIVGEPGSGKTVLLLQIALELLARAFQDEQYPIPVLLNLATWRDEGQSFDLWIEQNLVFAAGRSGVSKQVAKELVRSKTAETANQRNLIVLLDGLDEIPVEDRKSCVLAMQDFFRGQENNNPHNYPIGVVCCRVQEYLDLQTDLPSRAITQIIPLSLEKIYEELQKKNIKASEILLDIIRKHRAEIKEAQQLTTAFEVNLALNLAEGHLLYDFSPEKLDTQNLVDSYIDQESKKVKNYTAKKVTGYLSYLASKLQEGQKGITFELLDMQPDWYTGFYKYRLFYRLALGLVYGLVIGVFLGLFGGLFGGFSIGLFGGLFGGFSGYIFMFSRGVSREISPDEIRELNFKGFDWINFKRRFFLTFRLFALFGFFYGLTGGIVYEEEQHLTMGIIYGLVGALSGGLVVGFSGGLAGGFFKTKRHIKINDPYRRFYTPLIFDALQFFIPLFSIFFTIDAFFEGLLYEPINQILPVIILSLFFAVLFSPLLSHLSLRFLLWKEKSLPLRLVSFLNAVSGKSAIYDEKGNLKRKAQPGTGLMERDGGQWRFRHQLIQDRLAGKEIKK